REHPLKLRRVLVSLTENSDTVVDSLNQQRCRDSRGGYRRLLLIRQDGRGCGGAFFLGLSLRRRLFGLRLLRSLRLAPTPLRCRGLRFFRLWRLGLLFLLLLLVHRQVLDLLIEIV